jgi:hypothetical protein
MENQNQSQTPNVDKLPPEVKQQALEAARPSSELMDRATAQRQGSGNAGADHSGNREAMMHTQGAPGKSQEALSPTDSHSGQTQTQQRSQSRGRGMER